MEPPIIQDDEEEPLESQTFKVDHIIIHPDFRSFYVSLDNHYQGFLKGSVSQILRWVLIYILDQWKALFQAYYRLEYYSGNPHLPPLSILSA